MTGSDHTDDSPGASIEERLRRVEDLLEVTRLCTDYGAHLDAGRFAAYAQLFAAHGEIRLGPLGKANGPEEIEQLLSSTLEGRVGESFHLIGNPRVTIDGDEATSEVMWAALVPGKDGRPELSMLGRHSDTLVREHGRWRFQERQGLIDLPTTYPTD